MVNLRRYEIARRAREQGYERLAAISFQRCIDPAQIYPAGYAVYVT